MKLLDSTFLIDLLRGDKDTLVFLSKNETYLTTQINMYEVIRGLFEDSAPLSEIHESIALFDSIRVLPLDDAGMLKSAEVYAALRRRGQIISDCDCLTAGIALSKGVTKIVTKNAKHFSRIDGLKVISY